MRIDSEYTKYYKYKIIEYGYSKITYGDEKGKQIEVCKALHRTNSYLVFILIKLCLKLQGIRYEVLKNE